MHIPNKFTMNFQFITLNWIWHLYSIQEAFYCRGAHGFPASGYLEEHLRYVRKRTIQTKAKMSASSSDSSVPSGKVYKALTHWKQARLVFEERVNISRNFNFLQKETDKRNSKIETRWNRKLQSLNLLYILRKLQIHK